MALFFGPAASHGHALPRSDDARQACAEQDPSGCLSAGMVGPERATFSIPAWQTGLFVAFVLAISTLLGCGEDPVPRSRGLDCARWCYPLPLKAIEPSFGMCICAEGPVCPPETLPAQIEDAGARLHRGRERESYWDGWKREPATLAARARYERTRRTSR